MLYYQAALGRWWYRLFSASLAVPLHYRLILAGLFAITYPVGGYLAYTGRHALDVIIHHFLFNFVIAFL